MVIMITAGLKVLEKSRPNEIATVIEYDNNTGTIWLKYNNEIPIKTHISKCTAKLEKIGNWK